ncbi:MAG TPA: hypothetical protein VFZ97_16860 [Acidimicrobiales bacterium]
MTVVVGVVAGVAVVLLVASLVAWRSSSNRLAGAESRFVESQSALEDAKRSEEATRQELGEERRRGSESELRAHDAEERAGRAETRAVSAEAAMEALIASRSPTVLAEVERVRLEREWREVSGLDAPLPVRWDGSLEAALAIELEIIREVTGTPSRLENAGSGRSNAGVDDPKVWIMGSLGCELLRIVSRHADEMVVRLDPGPGMAPALAVESLGARSLPDLTSVEIAAKALGITVTVEQLGDGFVARMSAETDASA